MFHNDKVPQAIFTLFTCVVIYIFEEHQTKGIQIFLRQYIYTYIHCEPMYIICQNFFVENSKKKKSLFQQKTTRY